ncbi:MAG TPA: PQQ-binding-like beta-propeller repeat protein [Verrucomicrobiales bacterium]|nr:PQQ-binding-like beta-propeller repeat protein [Verrucomicrobiales bacterium]
MPTPFPLRLLSMLVLVVGCADFATAADWPRFRGPNGTGVSEEHLAEKGWPDGDLHQFWKTNVGIGFSSPVVSEGRLFISGNQSDTDSFYCLNAETGDLLWKHSWESEAWPYLYEGGTNATAAVDGAQVFTLGRHGPLFCFDAATGEVLWKLDLHRDLNLQKPSWGFTSAPLVSGELLILNAGSHGLALNKATGKVAWTTGTGDAAYAVPEPFDAQGTPALVIFGPASLAAVRRSDGSLLWETPWKTQFKVNAAQPIVRNNQIFVSSAYGFGCALFEAEAAGPREVWRNNEMQNHFNSCVLIGDHLYGISGTEASKAGLRCMEFATGKVEWTVSGAGLGSVIAAQDTLIVLTGRGELQFAKASPKAYQVDYRTQALGGKCWTPPCLAHGRIYCRNAAGDLVAVAAP